MFDVDVRDAGDETRPRGPAVGARDPHLVIARRRDLFRWSMERRQGGKTIVVPQDVSGIHRDPLRGGFQLRFGKGSLFFRRIVFARIRMSVAPRLHHRHEIWRARRRHFFRQRVVAD